MKRQRRAILTTLTTLSAFFLLNSCTIKKDGEPVDFGPEVTSDDLNKALLAPLNGLDPLSIKVGQFVHYSTIEEFAGGQVSEVVTDVGQTIVSQEDTPSIVRFDIVQESVSYLSGKDEKTSLQYQLNFAKAATPSQTTPAPSSSLMIAQLKTQLAATLASGITVPNLSSSAPPDPASPPASSPSPTPTTVAAPKVTFHRLTVLDSVDPAPDAVAQRPNCLGIPNCQLHVHHVTFDQVTWTGGQGAKVHFELFMSPDAPLLAGYRMTPLFEYYPGLIKTCISLMVAVGTTGSKTLLTECNQVEDFLYQAAPATN